MTLVHLFIMIAALSLGIICFVFTRQYFSELISLLISFGIFIFSLSMTFWLSCNFLHLLFKAVDKGWVEKPEHDLFERQIDLHRGNDSLRKE